MPINCISIIEREREREGERETEPARSRNSIYLGHAALYQQATELFEREREPGHATLHT